MMKISVCAPTGNVGVHSHISNEVESPMLTLWTGAYISHSDLTPEQLWPVIADVARWPEVDLNIAQLVITASPAPGVPFKLKPHGGPSLRFVIGHFDAPSRYSDICRMPLAVMETVHTLTSDAQSGDTRIEVRVEIRGPLARLWGRIVGQKHLAGLPAQTERIVARARELIRAPRLPAATL